MHRVAGAIGYCLDLDQIRQPGAALASEVQRDLRRTLMLTEIMFQSPIGILTIITLLGIVAFFGYVGYYIIHGMRQDKQRE